jgi:signal transduction histidine kinase
MIGKLYKKLYFYAIIILIASIILTITVITTIFQLSQKNVISEHFIKEATLIQRMLKQTNEERPDKLGERVRELSRQLNWNISYWKGNSFIYYSGKKPSTVPDSDLAELIKTRQPQILHRLKPPFEYLTFLDEKVPDKGYLILRFGNAQLSFPRLKPLIFAGGLVLLFLALLLIPYSLYILKPFKELMNSIHRVSQGDFSTTVSVPKTSEFSDLAEAFNNMTVKIQEMILQKQRLIADVSHELRSPLTRMRLSLEILAKDPEGRKKYIQKSISEIELLDRLIQDLLDISKFELDASNIKLHKTNLIEIVKESLEKHVLLFDEHQLNIHSAFPEENIRVNIDKNLMERALNNIFSNVVKYAPADSNVEIKIAGENNHVLLSIRDYGSGVNEDQFEKIFEPFYRVDDSRSRRTGGTGLGLSIVRKIIISHGGRVWASAPTDGQSGMVINIELPCN